MSLSWAAPRRLGFASHRKEAFGWPGYVSAWSGALVLSVVIDFG